MKAIIVGFGEKTKYFIDFGGLKGRVQVDEAVFVQHFPDHKIGDGSGLIGFKPQACEMLAVHPDQITEATDNAKLKGVPTAFDGLGRPVFTSRAHRKEYMEKYGFFDRSGGYSDARRNAPR